MGIVLRTYFLKNITRACSRKGNLVKTQPLAGISQWTLRISKERGLWPETLKLLMPQAEATSELNLLPPS